MFQVSLVMPSDFWFWAAHGPELWRVGLPAPGMQSGRRSRYEYAWGTSISNVHKIVACQVAKAVLSRVKASEAQVEEAEEDADEACSHHSC